MHGDGGALQLNWPTSRGSGQRARAVRTGTNDAMSNRPFFPAMRWRILDKVRQVAEISRARAFARRLCTGLSTDFLDNPIDIEARGEKLAIRRGGGNT